MVADSQPPTALVASITFSALLTTPPYNTSIHLSSHLQALQGALLDAEAGGERCLLVCTVAALEEKGLVPSGVFCASPVVSRTSPHKLHHKFLHGGFVSKTAFTLAFNPGSSW